jgi:hypothetical protein
MSNPYAGFTDSVDVVTQTILDKLIANASTLDVTDVNKSFFYGEQELLPTTPGFCVVPGPESSQYDGVAGRPVVITFMTFVMVYAYKVQDVQQNTKTAMQLATAVKGVIHPDVRLGGIVIDCFCSNVEPGYAIKRGDLIAAARLTFQSRSKVLLNP